MTPRKVAAQHHT